jgi:hypothetical protein
MFSKLGMFSRSHFQIAAMARRTKPLCGFF